ncbi:MAG TPA: hypothetical protein VFD70_04820 [Anaerolineae bacterium]|nr:hypothetical protein [Anaerolineae bacterium]
MPETEDERDGPTLDSETEIESQNENALDENADIRESASESEDENQEDEVVQADAVKGNEAVTKPVAVGNLYTRLGQFARAEEPYDWNRCTTVITLQIMPPRAEQDTAARKVFLSARTHADPPHTLNMQWSDLEPRLPEEIRVLLERVQQALPRRAAKRAADEQAERQRQEELKAQAEKRAAEKKAKEQTKASAARTVKRNKRVDLNTPPALPASQDRVETEASPAPSDSASPTNAPSHADANPEANSGRTQMSLF